MQLAAFAHCITCICKNRAQHHAGYNCLRNGCSAAVSEVSAVSNGLPHSLVCLTRHCTLDVVVMLQPIVVVEITVGGVLACSSSAAQRFKRDFRVSYRVHKPLSKIACNRPLREMECNIHVKSLCLRACMLVLIARQYRDRHSWSMPIPKMAL